jgi:hypothetical protein
VSRLAGLTAGTAGAGGCVAAMLGSPMPLLVLAGLVLIVLLALVVVVLTPVVSRDEARCARATAVLDRLLGAIPSGRSRPGGRQRRSSSSGARR